MLMEPLTGMRFDVVIGPYILGFSKVQGLKSQVMLTPIREGGVNDRVHMLPAPVQQNGKAVFERGWRGFTSLESFLLKPGKRIDMDVAVVVYNEWNIPAGELRLLAPVVVESWELGDISAKDSAVIVKRLTLIHSGIKEG